MLLLHFLSSSVCEWLFDSYRFLLEKWTGVHGMHQGALGPKEFATCI